MFNLAIDGKLRDCDVVAINVEDVAAGGYTADRATARQKKTGRPRQYLMLVAGWSHSVNGRSASSWSSSFATGNVKRNDIGYE
jgi:hypothetical protein